LFFQITFRLKRSPVSQSESRIKRIGSIKFPNSQDSQAKKEKERK